jgi:hypothetical protein
LRRERGTNAASSGEGGAGCSTFVRFDLLDGPALAGSGGSGLSSPEATLRFRDTGSKGVVELGCGTAAAADGSAASLAAERVTLEDMRIYY